MRPEPTTAAEVWASVRRLKPRPKAPVVHIKPSVIAKPVANKKERRIVRDAELLILIRRTVLEVAKMEIGDFESPVGDRRTFMALAAFYGLARNFTRANCQTIGLYAGGRCRTTVVKGSNSPTMKLPIVQALIAEVERRLNLKKPDTNRTPPVAAIQKGGGGPLTKETIDAEPRESSQEGFRIPSNQSIPRNKLQQRKYHG